MSFAVVERIKFYVLYFQGGFYTRNLPYWLDWIKFMSFLHFSFHAAMVLEFTNAPPIQ